MTTIVHALNDEWATLACSPKARRALMRWTARHPELGQVQSLNDFVDTRGRRDWGTSALRVLATEAPDDEVAARTLLQALLGGVVRVVAGVVHDEPPHEPAFRRPCIDQQGVPQGVVFVDARHHRPTGSLRGTRLGAFRC